MIQGRSNSTWLTCRSSKKLGSINKAGHHSLSFNDKPDLPKFVFVMQMGKFEKAIEYGKKGIELASSELSIRLGSKIDHNNKAKVYKIKRMFETIVLLFIDMGLAHEGKVIISLSYIWYCLLS